MKVVRCKINQTEKQTTSLLKKKQLCLGDYAVKELGIRRQIFMKPPEPGSYKGLVFIITKLFSGLRWGEELRY